MSSKVNKCMARWKKTEKIMIMILLLYYLLRMSDMINIRFLYNDARTDKEKRKKYSRKCTICWWVNIYSRMNNYYKKKCNRNQLLVFSVIGVLCQLFLNKFQRVLFQFFFLFRLLCVWMRVRRAYRDDIIVVLCHMCVQTYSG